MPKQHNRHWSWNLVAAIALSLVAGAGCTSNPSQPPDVKIYLYENESPSYERIQGLIDAASDDDQWNAKHGPRLSLRMGWRHAVGLMIEALEDAPSRKEDQVKFEMTESKKSRRIRELLIACRVEHELNGTATSRTARYDRTAEYLWISNAEWGSWALALPPLPYEAN